MCKSDEVHVHRSRGIDRILRQLSRSTAAGASHVVVQLLDLSELAAAYRGLLTEVEGDTMPVPDECGYCADCKCNHA